MRKTSSDDLDPLHHTGRAGLNRGSARSVLMTILGELVWPTDQPARTSALLEVMTGLGIEEATARQGIIRAADSGWITGEKRGREVSWSITPYLKAVFTDGSERVDQLSNPFTNWDSRWLVLFITVPQAKRSHRKRLYRDLAWVGFGNPSPGLWLSPHGEQRDRASAVIDRLGLTSDTMSFLGPVESVGLSEEDIVKKGWDLQSVAEDYASTYEEFRAPAPANADELLLTAIRAVGELQRFPFSDPQLPEALLPNWIGRTVTAHIQSLRRRWSGPVAERWAELNS